MNFRRHIRNKDDKLSDDRVIVGLISVFDFTEY